MSNLHQPRNAKWAIVATFAACTALALYAEWNPFQFIYGISFSFASLFVMLTVRLFGLRGGLLAAVLTYATGTFLMNNPTFHLIGILEAACVALMLRRYKGQLFRSTLIFWLLIGLPIFYISYTLQNGASALDVRLIACIVAVNALFNALFAEIIYQYVPLSRWSRLSSIKRLPISISQLLVHLTLGIVMAAFLLNMIVNYISSLKEVSLHAQEIARQTVLNISKEWMGTAAPASAVTNGPNVRLQYLINRFVYSNNTVSVMDNDNIVIASSNSEILHTAINPWENSSKSSISNTLSLSVPNNERFSPKIRSWQNAKFVYTEPLKNGSGQFIVEIPLSHYQNYLFGKYMTHFLYLIGFAFVATCIALYINYSLSRSLLRLAVSTKNLPLKLKQNNTFDLPQSSIIEIHTLISNFKHMAGSLLYLFHESQKNTERLLAQAQLLQQSEERLHQLAYYDDLTELPNRLQFTKYFQELIAISSAAAPGNINGQKIAVFFTDINRFKQVNDTLGHSVGDKLLTLSAQRFLKLTSRESSVFRLGGDEFVFVTRFKEESEMSQFAQSICDSFVEPFVVDGMPLFLSVSVGISQYPRDGEDMDTIIRNADIAMYNAKEEGFGCYRFFKPKLVSDITEKMQLENGLYKALQENQFSLFYQPRMNAVTGELCGIEALIRWQHPELGMVPPDKFIPLAEESGFILEIDNWVFREACRQNKEWQDNGLKRISVSVNISARHFYQGNLCEMIENGLRDTGLEPEYVSLEITEGVFMRNIEKVIDTILYLRKLGIQISIDDFGTGYSSLNQLQRLPISDVKLDRSFIQGITNDEKKSSIVKAIIELVHSMNMKVVAEGVETVDESQFCKDMKCDELQGYLFSKPLPAGQIEELLRQESTI